EGDGFRCGVGFFFQAEDGIRDFHVTGVQTCALPILVGWPSPWSSSTPPEIPPQEIDLGRATLHHVQRWRGVADLPGDWGRCVVRSEERRVGKEWRSRWAADHDAYHSTRETVVAEQRR